MNSLIICAADFSFVPSSFLCLCFRFFFTVLVGKAEGRRPHRRRRRVWKDNIRMDLREIGWESVSWICLAQGRDQWRDLVYTVMNHRDP